jgi:hypothetical protein
MTRQRANATGTDIANDDVDETSPRRGRVLASLVEGQHLLNEAVTKVADFVTREKEEKKESDPWKAAVEKAMGKAFPSDLRDEKLTEMNILEPRIACDPLLLLLVMTATEMEGWVESSVLPGPLLRRWRGIVSQDAVWLPQSAKEDHSFLQRTIDRLQDKILALSLAFFRWPASVPPAIFLLEQQHLINEAMHLAKELEGKVLRIRAGPKAAAEFFQAYRVNNRQTAASFIPSLARIKIGGQKKRLHQDDEVSSDSEPDVPEQKKNNRRKKRWSGPRRERH